MRGILGVDPAFDRVPLQLKLLLGELERLAAGDLDLRAHDVDAGHELRDRVLDLDARVHLHEVVGAVGREQAFDRARRPVPGSACGIDGDLPDPGAQLGADRG